MKTLIKSNKMFYSVKKLLEKTLLKNVQLCEKENISWNCHFFKQICSQNPINWKEKHLSYLILNITENDTFL